MSARVVMLTGGSPWGLTLSGGKDFGSFLQIMKLTPGGKAMKSGIKEREYILAINSDDTEGMTHHQAQQKIRNTGQTLTLKLTSEKPVKGSGTGSAPSTPISKQQQQQPGDSSPSASRPKPPPAPTPPAQSSSPVKQTKASTPTYQSKTTPTKPHHTPQQPVQSQVPVHQRPTEKISAVSNEPPPSASKIVPDSGLNTGYQSTTQSPAFKKITVESPSVFSKSPNAPPTPPTDQMRNVVIEERNVMKTSQRPQPPPNNPTQFTSTTMRLQSNTGPKAQASVPRPAPPPTTSYTKPPPPPSPSSVSGTTMNVPPQSPNSAKITPRQGVCEACRQPIRGAYASAMNKVWHPEHFVCYNCHNSLSNGTFVFEEEKIFCDKCYEQTMAQTCFKCRRPIVGQVVNAANNHYHRACFQCSKCFTDLTAQSGFNMEANELFCADCFSGMFGATCNACGNKIAGNELWVEALDQTWHPQCFICDGCRAPLDGTKFFAKSGRPYCGQCC